MSEVSQTSTRGQMIDLVSRLVVGPLSEDEALSSPPLDTYLSGILWPEGEMLDAPEESDDDNCQAPAAQDGETDGAVPGYRAVRPCSVGLTFAADRNATVTVNLGSTARYAKVETEPAEEGGRRQTEWRRIELGLRYAIQPGGDASFSTNEFVDADGETIVDEGIRLHVKRRVRDERQVLTVTLINSAIEADDRLRNELCLFQAMLRIEACSEDGRGAITPRPSPLLAGADDDARSAALLYRDVVEFAVGHGIAVMWEDTAERRVGSVWTSWMPHTALKNMSAEGHSTLLSFLKDQPHTLRAEWLADHQRRSDVVAALRGFNGCYREWTRALRARVDDFEGDLGIAAHANLKNCELACTRIEKGIDLLETSDGSWLAFTLANSAMDRQARFEVKKPRQGPLVWRPFQLAYILMALPGLVDSEDEYRDWVDLLWFPTGGGKTEAYLGLTAFEIFHRRLTSAERRDIGGVDVLMRYTLRLLTVQQFQRAASLICACDQIRQERSDLGDAPISLGLYVGGDATPNRKDKAVRAIEEEHEGLKPKSTPRQLLNCPVCGHELAPAAYQVAGDEDGIDIRCPAAACATEGQPLPVLAVDDFIYASPPSLLIGTIDKFAQLPRRSDLGTLFGLDGALGPGLIIQDELHLISGPLGSISGLYETVIDMLAARNGARPKVIGSTATIGQARKQVRALFDREVLQFPPAGFEAADSFFAVRDNEGPDRVYLGLCSAGRSPKFALQAAAAALLQSSDFLKQEGASPKEIDPFWTSVLYFNSLRELGGAHVLVQDDIPRQMEFLAGRLVRSSGKASTKRALEADTVELSSRVSSRELPDHLNNLNHGLEGVEEDPFAPEPRDVVLASNMISVGVDVPRLGLMLVNGQPKSTAEYIQASSRVGRGRDGLVLTLYNFGRPRDVSHFEHFLAYHNAIYRSVEATSVTPWAPRARDKALHAVLAAAVRHLVDRMEDDDAAGRFAPNSEAVREIIKIIEDRAFSASENVEGEDTVDDLAALIEEWTMRSSDASTTGKALRYWDPGSGFSHAGSYLMRSAEDGRGTGRKSWPTPNSMREVEPSTAFMLKNIRSS
ncbi:hypothetical protein K3179_00360 [Qipengyuania sp. GH38]|uniref:helicase-related protein n=1 Tax=Qipengyuania intermedia TaxID=2867244 RepID=UPI001C87A84E|nr:helicase-related protein [Qipengyuania intermedia]MBX7512989.1 hypothetical protein [Qipengyuania intermedia]